MKICTRCGHPKSPGQFAKRSASRDGLASWCKECYAEHAREKFQNDSSERERKRRNCVKQAERAREAILGYLHSHPCVDCGTTDVRVLEFDHRDETLKEFNISHKFWALSVKKLMAEIEKCDVRCANCHRIRTAEQFGTWRALL